MNMKNIWNFDLIRGKGKSPRDGACLLDAVSWFEYGRLGDHPPCVCPVIAAYGRGLNDLLPHDRRQELKRFLPRLPGTVDGSSEHERAEYAVRRTVRKILPIILRFRDHEDLARLCEELSANAAVGFYVISSYGSAAAAAAALAAAAAAADAAYAAHVAAAVKNDVYTTAISIFGGMLDIGRSSDTATERWAIASGRFAEAMRSS